MRLFIARRRRLFSLFLQGSLQTYKCFLTLGVIGGWTSVFEEC